MERVDERIPGHMQMIGPRGMLNMEVELFVSFIVPLGNGSLKIGFADCFFPIEHHGN